MVIVVAAAYVPAEGAFVARAMEPSSWVLAPSVRVSQDISTTKTHGQQLHHVEEVAEARAE